VILLILVVVLLAVAVAVVLLAVAVAVVAVAVLWLSSESNFTGPLMKDGGLGEVSTPITTLTGVS